MPRGIYPHKSPTQETIEKRRQSNIGQRRTVESRQRMKEAQKRCGNRPPSRKGVIYGEPFREKCRLRRGSKAPWWHRHHRIETRIRLSEQRRGAMGSNWQGGITPLAKLERRSVMMKLWKEAVLARDNYTCQQCGSKGPDVRAHHIKSFTKHPELRYDVRNGSSLCLECHKKTPNYGGRVHNSEG
jgi:hypothetical protein